MVHGGGHDILNAQHVGAGKIAAHTKTLTRPAMTLGVQTAEGKQNNRTEIDICVGYHVVLFWNENRRDVKLVDIFDFLYSLCVHAGTEYSNDSVSPTKSDVMANSSLAIIN